MAILAIEKFGAVCAWRYIPPMKIACLASVLGLSAISAQAAIDCQPGTFDVKQLRSQVVLVGEAHGTREAPAFVGGLVCSLLQEGKSVVLGVERDAEEQAQLDAFIQSRGSKADQEALFAGRTEWRSKCQDGRTSEAMLALLEEVRRLRSQGARAGVLALRGSFRLDVPTTDAENEPLSREDNMLHNRIADRQMADKVLNAAILYRAYTLVALTGYSHAATVQGYSGNPEWRPMGNLVVASMSADIIGLQTEGGEHWAAGRTCGPRPIAAGDWWASGARVDYTVNIGKVTLSGPALQPLP